MGGLAWIENALGVGGLCGVATPGETVAEKLLVQNGGALLRVEALERWLSRPRPTCRWWW
jgi:hypothetical protein